MCCENIVGILTEAGVEMTRVVKVCFNTLGCTGAADVLLFRLGDVVVRGKGWEMMLPWHPENFCGSSPSDSIGARDVLLL
jgi:hypothetical protein